MNLGLKITGLTEVKKMFDENKKTITDAVKNLNGTDLKASFPNIGLDLDLSEFAQANKPLIEIQKGIKKAHMKAVKLMAAEFSKALDDAMESNVWDWKGDTRDIIDTGELKNSKKVIVDSDGDIHVFYGTDYAAIVHYGGYFYPYGHENAKTFYPGRPWVKSLIEGGGPIDQFDFNTIYGILFVSELNKLIS
tara:strand:+ start:1825 stop:2400 length:576 start_codon:yes stop_codon:yes gene_type:complete